MLTKNGKYRQNFLQIIIAAIAFLFPEIGRAINYNFFDPIAMNFFIGIIKSQLKERNYKPTARNDFIDVLLQQSSQTSGKDEQAFTREELERSMIASAFVLFFAGFETSSSVMSSTCFFLAKNLDKQEILYREIRDAITANDQKDIDYDTLQGLPYLEMCIHESLRLYPLTFLERMATKNYQFKGTNIKVAKGELVQIAAPAIMKDEKYFHNPEQFNPENFSEEAVHERGPYPYMGFGLGPRNCVGKRFALLSVKNALYRTIYNFELLPCEKTIDQPIPDPFSQWGGPIGGFWIKLQNRKHE